MIPFKNMQNFEHMHFIYSNASDSQTEDLSSAQDCVKRLRHEYSCPTDRHDLWLPGLDQLRARPCDPGCHSKTSLSTETLPPSAFHTCSCPGKCSRVKTKIFSKRKQPQQFN